MDDVLIATIEKNKGEVVHVTLKEYQDHDLFDIRVHYKPPGGGEPKPTGKGVCGKVKMLPELIAALRKAEETARAAGLIDDVKEGEAA